MQMIYPVRLNAAEYVACQAHLKIRPPSRCPQCGNSNSLSVLGVYTRSVTASGSGRIVTIKVRRFLCCECNRTLSLLPSFAQPYRLVCGDTIDRSFAGASLAADTLQWHTLLRRYWRRFCGWFPKLLQRVGSVLGLPPPLQPNEGSWHALVAAYGHLDMATRTLVRNFRVTVFGKYRCHEPGFCDVMT